MNLNKLKIAWMSLNETKWALNELKPTKMGLKEPKWAQILITILPVMHTSVRHDICYDF